MSEVVLGAEDVNMNEIELFFLKILYKLGNTDK